jgi:hypothetical protein
MTKVPAEFTQYARVIALADSSPFKTALEVRETMAKLYEAIQNPETTDTTTGGIYFHKDGDGDIELYIAPWYLPGAPK